MSTVERKLICVVLLLPLLCSCGARNSPPPERATGILSGFA